MSEELNKVFAYIDAHKEEALDFWKGMVVRESYTDEVENVKACAEYIKAAYEKEGFECQFADVGESSCPSITGIYGKERPGKPVVLMGHFDTVHPKGAFGAEPWKLGDDGNVYGPGVADMKGGIAVGLLTAKALKNAGFSDRPIKIIFSGNEETGHAYSTGKDVFGDYGKGAACAFNLEPGVPEGQLVTGRKGMMRFGVKVHGVEAHAGRNFFEGANAIWEMSQKVNAISNLTDEKTGTTCNFGTIKGGKIPNSVPDYCEAALDTRFVTVEEAEKLKVNIEKILDTTYVKGTTTEYGIFSEFGVFETTEEGLRFYNFIEATSNKYGLKYGHQGHVYLGGSSDASYTTLAGIPTICGSGVKGAKVHTLKEYAIVDTLYDMAKLVSAVIYDLNGFSK